MLKLEYLSSHQSDIPKFECSKFKDAKYFKLRRPPIEDDLKILKMKYLSNHWFNLTQIRNLSLGDHSKVSKWSNIDYLQWKRTSKYKDLNIASTNDQIFTKLKFKPGCLIQSLQMIGSYLNLSLTLRWLNWKINLGELYFSHLLLFYCISQP